MTHNFILIHQYKMKQSNRFQQQQRKFALVSTLHYKLKWVISKQFNYIIYVFILLQCTLSKTYIVYILIQMYCLSHQKDMLASVCHLVFLVHLTFFCMCFTHNVRLSHDKICVIQKNKCNTCVKFCQLADA